MPKLNDKCFNCGGIYGIHQVETEKCPEGGVDCNRYDTPTTFIPKGLTSKGNTEARIEALERRVQELERRASA